LNRFGFDRPLQVHLAWQTRSEDPAVPIC